MKVFVLFYCTLFYYYSIEAYLFIMRDRNKMVVDVRGSGEEQEGYKGWGN